MTNSDNQLITPNFFDGDSILSLEPEKGKAIFQNLPVASQVQMVMFADSAQKAEELIYLVPDAKELIQSLPYTTVAKIVEPQLDVNPVGVLSEITSDQLLAIADTMWWDGRVLNETEVIRWVLGISLCPPRTIETLLPVVIGHIILTCYGRVKISVNEEDSEEERSLKVFQVLTGSLVNISDLSIEEEVMPVIQLLNDTDVGLVTEVAKAVINMDQTSFDALSAQKHHERAERLGLDSKQNEVPTEKDLVLTTDEEIEL